MYERVGVSEGMVMEWPESGLNIEEWVHEEVERQESIEKSECNELFVRW